MSTGHAMIICVKLTGPSEILIVPSDPANKLQLQYIAILYRLYNMDLQSYTLATFLIEQKL